ncbi:MAG TPA: glycosyl transferase [Cyanobacteria bacterium UBA11369]|nr:glycosyl transferase [Cyanobacteria bacterium UBA11371]HBE49054.1 glycosyl transferase [Cyanobacteria bacterium UBA11369]
MRVLLSTIGSRGDVQPLVALALALRNLGQEVHLCVPPDFRDWIESLGMPVTPIGPFLRSTGKANPSAALPTPEQRRQMMEGTLAIQFETIAAAAFGCDIIVGATALQIAAPSVAERMGIPYIFAAYCPTVLPSPHHAPPVLVMLGDTSARAMVDYRELWDLDARRWNDMWGVLLNSHRASLGLRAVNDVRSYILTDRPWLAADPTLAPWPDPADRAVFQTGAWILPDERPLSPELSAFLDAGSPPVYFGFGSIRAPENLSQVIINSARALKRRAIVSRGWADLSVVDNEPDCLVIGEVNQQALFKRVAAVVHHGGAGTTTAAARAGAPQVVIPQYYDQHYWAGRIHHLGIGTAHEGGTPTTEELTSAMRHALQPDVAARARSIATAVHSNGALLAAQRLITADKEDALQKRF